MQGYLTLATGRPLYFEAAVNLALSVKLNDPSRPISLLCDDASKVNFDYKKYFDQLIELPPHKLYRGCGDKIRMPLYTPYEETMFVDADCVIAKPDMDRHWEKMAAIFFGMPGGKITTGYWYGKSIENMMASQNVPHIVQMNSGVFYFRQCKELIQLIDEAMALAESGPAEMQIEHRGQTQQLADEPIWGVLMAKNNIEPIQYQPSEGSISISTFMAKKIVVDALSGQSDMEKSKGFYFLNRLFSKGWVKHSPSIPHFVAFKPRKKYQAIANAIRDHYSLTPFQF